jgi:hypothetical protein
MGRKQTNTKSKRPRKQERREKVKKQKGIEKYVNRQALP